jgi:hypothetical protein
MDHFSKARPTDLSATDRLSERQKQCLELVAAGYTSKQIARQLNLSPSTVDNHLIDPRSSGSMDGPLRDDSLPPAVREVKADNDDGLVASLFSIPPMGGRDNRLTQRRRYYHVVQIMILALMAFSAVTVTIAGIVHLFSQ